MTSRLDKVLTIGFCALWAIFIFIDYWYYHPDYAISFTHFQYYDTLLLLGVLGGGIYFTINKWKNNRFIQYISGGAGVYLLLMLITSIILWTHYYKVSNELLSIFAGFTLLGKISYILLMAYAVFMACYVLGSLVMTVLFSIEFQPREARIIKLGVGITMLSFLLTILAFFGVFKALFVFPLLIGILGIGWKSTLAFLQSTLLKPLTLSKNFNWIGFTSFFLTLIFISLVFLSNVRPVPYGFDALAVYLNLPNLISQNGSLVEGYSPYYWSIFIALGNVIFGKLEIVIALSAGGGILSLFAIYEISRKWIDTNFSLSIVAIFYSLPIINYQSFRDIKTDLGLLFILLTAFLVLIKWISAKENADKTKKEITTNGEEVGATKGLLSTVLSESEQLAVILGILSGMAIGIKLTGLIFILAVLAVFSYQKGGIIGFFANFALTIFVVLIGGLDTSLRAYHFGTDALQWIMGFIGLVALGYVGYKQKGQLISLIKISAIYLFLVGIVYAPWPVKNYQETGELGINTLIEGKPVGIPEYNPKGRKPKK